ncbi:hypothetical protein V6Z11_A04G147300 [Gossypium hirsutum]
MAHLLSVYRLALGAKICYGLSVRHRVPITG